MRITLINQRAIILFIVISTCFGCSDKTEKQDSFIPKSKLVRADILILSALDKIDSSFDSQISGELLDSYLEKVGPRQSLEYSKNLGVSENEYSVLTKILNKPVRTKNDDVAILFSLKDNGIIEISGLPGIPLHNNVAYDTNRDVIISGWGELSDISNINQDSKSSFTGRWHGKQWKLDDIQSALEFTVVKFAIGQMTDRAKNIIYYDAKIFKNGLSEVYFYVLLYDSD